ncbi:hypothetical protein BT96DRAFT_1044359 [Gymnopus androsaceus JB14]|uniref:Uncharacterized protein n=1 Tax=Gymnopus androsaceus JB14 TaxID=1447944 RepID=A0A6A4HCJ4_9AGAR|nr:hypothetical protein BT96DRAFT_1044359 [Gymnopus androsaceus JB14]
MRNRSLPLSLHSASSFLHSSIESGSGSGSHSSAYLSLASSEEQYPSRRSSWKRSRRYTHPLIRALPTSISGSLGRGKGKLRERPWTRHEQKCELLKSVRVEDVAIVPDAEQGHPPLLQRLKDECVIGWTETGGEGGVENFQRSTPGQFSRIDRSLNVKSQRDESETESSDMKFARDKLKDVIWVTLSGARVRSLAFFAFLLDLSDMIYNWFPLAYWIGHINKQTDSFDREPDTGSQQASQSDFESSLRWTCYGSLLVKATLRFNFALLDKCFEPAIGWGKILLFNPETPFGNSNSSPSSSQVSRLHSLQPTLFPKLVAVVCKVALPVKLAMPPILVLVLQHLLLITLLVPLELLVIMVPVLAELLLINQAVEEKTTLERKAPEGKSNILALTSGPRKTNVSRKRKKKYQW